MQEDELVLIGQEAAVFKKGRLYKYLEKRSLQERDDAIAALIRCSPDDIKRNTEYRNKISIAEATMLWLDEAIFSTEARM